MPPGYIFFTHVYFHPHLWNASGARVIFREGLELESETFPKWLRPVVENSAFASDSLCSFENTTLKEKNSCIKMRNLANAPRVCALLSTVL